MQVNPKLLFLFLLLQIGCSENISVKTINENIPASPVKTVQSNNNANIPAKVSKTNTEITKELSEADKNVIYCTLLTYIGYEEDPQGKFEGGFYPGTQLVYGKNTIPPKDFEQLKSDPEIKESLLLNFEKVNQKIQPLENRYDVTVVTQPFLGEADILKFYKAAKRKYPKTKAVVNFSNISIDYADSIGLVYVEYYRPGRGSERFYYEMGLRKAPEMAESKASFSNVDTFRKIPVN